MVDDKYDDLSEFINDDDSDYNDETIEEENVNNSDLSFTNKSLYLRLNNDLNAYEQRNNNLRKSLIVLRSKFPEIEFFNRPDAFELILQEEFTDGFSKTMYIRNMSYEYTDYTGKSKTANMLGIRPCRVPGSFLDRNLPEGYSLMFKGHVSWGRNAEFVIDSIYDTYDGDGLEYEVQCEAVCYLEPGRSTDRFLTDILNLAGSITKHTHNCLEEWRGYLNWKQALTKRQIYGFKYIKVDFDDEKQQLSFLLICKDEESFKKNKKYLNRGNIQAFNNGYSMNRWEFVFNDPDNGSGRKKVYGRGVELGRFRGIKKAFYRIDDENTEPIDEELEHQLYDKQAEEEIAAYYDDNEEESYDNMDEEDDDDYTKVLGNNPYFVEVAFELNSHDGESFRDVNFANPDEVNRVRENLLEEYYPSGFLALSAVGEIVLNRRLDKAIQDMEQDYNCSSPNLSLWLFDVTKARLPLSIDTDSVTKWLNPDVAKNENQRMAVYKMLAAPDLCMIQGPPGTGKTTVIAEAIYQFVREGKRVLITSQSNDAVDNALERLLDSPEVRAIRLGRKGKKNKNKNVEDIEENKYSENLALKFYYHVLAKQIEASWLNKWNANDATIDECQADKTNIALCLNNINNNNANRNSAIEKRGGLIIERNKVESNIQRATKYNQDIDYQKVQFANFKNLIESDNLDVNFILNDELAHSYLEKVTPCLLESKNKGIFLVDPVLLERVDELTGINASKFILMIYSGLKKIEEIRKKLLKVSDTGLDANAAFRIAELEKRKMELDAKLEADSDSDDDMENFYERKKIIKEIKKIKSGVNNNVISTEEEAYLDEFLRTQIKSNKGFVADELVSAVKKFRETSKAAFNSVNAKVEAMKPVDLVSMQEELNVLNGRIKHEGERITIFNEADGKYHKDLQIFLDRYKANDEEELRSNIETKLQEAKNKQSKEASIRHLWEDSYKEFVKRLTDDENYSNDQKYYNQTYINACNVVGISCTDNMRNLTDNGFEDFDVVIIDEVSKATPPELLIPLLKARKAILVGDHRQLPPMFDEHERSYKELIEKQTDDDDFQLTEADFKRYEKMITASMFKDYFEHADPSIKHSLLTQYRMHSDIMNVINRFYEYKLSNGLKAAEEEVKKNHMLTLKDDHNLTFIRPDCHAYWIDSSALPHGQPMYEMFKNNSTSACNIFEVYLIMELLIKMAAEYTKLGYGGKKKKTVGIISFYQMQVNDLRRAFVRVKLENKEIFNSINVDINTVDRFQGKEKNIIITSLVRNNKQGRASKHIVAFERINVAFSRAQELLVIVGATHLYKNLEVELPNMDTEGTKTARIYENIIRSFKEEKGALISSVHLINDELEKEILEAYNNVRENK